MSKLEIQKRFLEQMRDMLAKWETHLKEALKANLKTLQDPDESLAAIQILMGMNWDDEKEDSVDKCATAVVKNIKILMPFLYSILTLENTKLWCESNTLASMYLKLQFCVRDYQIQMQKATAPSSSVPQSEPVQSFFLPREAVAFPASSSTLSVTDSLSSAATTSSGQRERDEDRPPKKRQKGDQIIPQTPIRVSQSEGYVAAISQGSLFGAISPTNSPKRKSSVLGAPNLRPR